MLTLDNLLLIFSVWNEPCSAEPEWSRFIQVSREQTDWKYDNLPSHEVKVKISKIRLCNLSLFRASLRFFIKSIITILFIAFDRCWGQPSRIVLLHIFLVGCCQGLFVLSRSWILSLLTWTSEWVHKIVDFCCTRDQKHWK